jgi:hypothetical protein
MSKTRISDFRSLCLQINENNFDEIALEIFRFQAKENLVYRKYLNLIGVSPDSINSVFDIPFLPIQFFKTTKVMSGSWVPETIFRSSGTTGINTSSHMVDDFSFYLNHAAADFNQLITDISEAHLLAVLPSYTERADSSLVAMVDHLVKLSGSTFSGFYLNDKGSLQKALCAAKATGAKVILFGVTFALMDLVSAGIDFSGVDVIETGGMKGRGKEVVREELYRYLRQSKPNSIFSEYGMTELFSQAYAGSDGKFKPSSWMRVLIREINDPFKLAPSGTLGVIRVIDLANVHSCCFIETQDLGKSYRDGGFEVLGRLDYSDLRGCNLLFENAGLL